MKALMLMEQCEKTDYKVQQGIYFVLMRKSLRFRTACIVPDGTRPCCSWFICLHPGETAKPRPWIRTSSTATASPPVALTAKRATWWTTATAAWCTCPVGNLPTCCIKGTHRANIDVNVCFLHPRRCALLHPRAVQRMCSPSSRWEWKTLLAPTLSRPTCSHLTADSFRSKSERRLAQVELLSTADFLVERDNDFCVCETPCNMTRYNKELSFVKIPSKASAKYLAKKYNKSEQYIK